MIANIEPVGAKPSAHVYHLKVALLGTKPAIWRRLQVPGNANLGWLHAVLQLAIGWTNSHLHHFLTSEARYSDPRNNEDMGFCGSGDHPTERQNGQGKVLLSVCQTCKYTGEDFLDFLRSGEKDIGAFAESRPRQRRPSGSTRSAAVRSTAASLTGSTQTNMGSTQRRQFFRWQF